MQRPDDSASASRPGGVADGRPGFRLAASVIRYYRLCILIVVALLIYGVYSFVTLPRTEDPEFDSVDVRVIILFPGVFASKVEDLVTKPVEQALEEVDGIREIEAESSAGLSFFKIVLYNDADPDGTIEEIEERVEDLRDELPDGAHDPIVFGFNAGKIAVNVVSLSGPDDYRLLDRWSQRIKEELTTIDEVSRVEVHGLPERQIVVRVDNDRLAQYRIPLLRVYDIVGLENAAVPGGKLDVGPRRYLLKMPNEYRSLEEIRDTVIGSDGESVVRLRDIATVEDGFEELRYLVRTNRKAAVLFSVTKRQGTNTIAVAEKVRATIRELDASLPEELDLRVISDRGRSVADLLSNLGWNAVGGGVAVLIVVSLFLGVRQAAVVSISIPLSILIAFILMSWFSVDLHQISIFGLILALGMLVDSGLVVVENIGRHFEAGETPFDAVTRGVEDVKLPVISATLTTIAAFVPMLYVQGNVGRFLGEMPKTVIFSLSASLVVSLTVISLLFYALWSYFPPSSSAGHDDWRLVGLYTETAKFALRHRLLTLSLALIAFAASLYVIPYLGIQFFPKAEKSFFFVNVRLPSEANLATTVFVTSQVEDLLAEEEVIEDMTSCIGKGCPRVYYNVEPENEKPSYAQILVNLREDFPGARVEGYALDLKEKLGQVTGATVEPLVMQQGPSGGAAIEVRISGSDLEMLASLADQVEQLLHGVSGLVDLRDSLGEKTPQLVMELNRDKAGLLGADSFSFSRTLYIALNGEVASHYRAAEDEIPLVVRLDRGSILEVSDLNRLYVPSARGGVVPFAEISTIREEGVFASTRRRNGQRVVIVEGDVAGRLSNDVFEDVRQRLSGLSMPEGYEVEVGGENEERAEAFGGLAVSMAVAILLMYAILAIQFNSFVQPFVILFTVPFGIVGAVFGLLVTGNPFGQMAFIGIVSLTGIIINDSIVLTDFANYLQRVEKKRMYEALLEAGRMRFRPVLTTSLTTIAGMTPLAIWGGSLWSPVASAIIFGLAFSTVLILLVLPVLYSLLVRPEESRRAFRFWPRLSARLLGREG